MPSETQTKSLIPARIAEILAMPNESTQKTLAVALALCLVFSLLVASATVLLRPLQSYNKALEKKTLILQVAGLLEPGKGVDELFKQVETRIVDLDSGEYVDSINPADYDQAEAAKDPSRSQAIPPQDDIASIRRRAKFAPVYLVQQDGKLKTLVLPVRGYGLWSTMHGFLALKSDANTIAGLNFYQHAETPGLGGEISNPSWQALWVDKLAYDDKGQPRIEVIKGNVDPNNPQAKYEVEGIAGATLTSRGVSNLVRYWLSEGGFGIYLAKLRSQKG